MLMPWDTHLDDFLSRFLDHSGPGPHHLTFKVKDIEAELATARRLGFEPIGVDLTSPEWMEAFIHPKQATGVVVQLAQSSHSEEDATDWAVPPPEGFPSGRRQRRDGSGPIRPADLEWVVHAVADPAVARALFIDLLRGTVVGSGHTGSVGWTAISWGGPLGVRLLWPRPYEPADTTSGHVGAERMDTAGPADDGLAQWLAGRPGRIHHLDMRVDDPVGVPGAVETTTPLCLVGSGTTAVRWEVPAADNAGLRLVLAGTDRPVEGTGTSRIDRGRTGSLR
jgi:hypothetical protein